MIEDWQDVSEYPIGGLLVKQRKSDDNPWRGAVIVSAIGADLAVCLGAGYWVGAYVDRRLDTGMLWTLIGLSAGFVIGVIGAIFLVRYFAEDNNDHG